jgi:chemotaxis protein methyltransferase CheR
MTLSRDCLKYFADFIEKEVGIVYTEVNYYQLETRLMDIAKQIGLTDSAALWEKVRVSGINGDIKQLVLDIATNNETSFFRDPNVFKLIQKVAKDFAEKRTGETCSVWSAASSTGQEMYSLAMTFFEIAQTIPFTYTIHASDISERVLARAERGAYTQLEAQRGLSAVQIVKHFDQNLGNGDETFPWTVKSHLRRGITFKKRNLLDTWHDLGSFNLILCRNVLIYQTVENKRKVVEKLVNHLKPDGCLILGGAESLIGISDSLEYVAAENAVMYRKKPLGQVA